MASFHLAVKMIGRSAGRSATAAAAYRAGVEITDERTRLVHDYTRKQGVEHNAPVVPADAPAWASDRAVHWSAAEQTTPRTNSTVPPDSETGFAADVSPQVGARLEARHGREPTGKTGGAVSVGCGRP